MFWLERSPEVISTPAAWEPHETQSYQPQQSETHMKYGHMNPSSLEPT